jgi:ribosomal protein S12 methylthiotransferase accessory factor YcaO
MKRALLVVTPAPDDANLSSLQSLIERARQTGTKIFIWLVDSPFNFTTGGAKALQDLATQTGGQFFTFSGIESIPDPEQYLDTFACKFLN